MAQMWPGMSARVAALHRTLAAFVETECIPAEAAFEAALDAQPGGRWAAVPAVLEQLKARARELGLWNLFLPREFAGEAGLTNVEYAPLAELMG